MRMYINNIITMVFFDAHNNVYICIQVSCVYSCIKIHIQNVHCMYIYICIYIYVTYSEMFSWWMKDIYSSHVPMLSVGGISMVNGVYKPTYRLAQMRNMVLEYLST